MTPGHHPKIFFRLQQGFLKTRGVEMLDLCGQLGKLQSCVCLVLEAQKILDEMQVKGYIS